MAENLFLQSRHGKNRDDYYKALKKFTPADKWRETVERQLVTAEKSKDFDNFTARIMREHQLWRRLFLYCLKRDIHKVEEFENDLKPHFEKEILGIYESYVENQAFLTEWHAYNEVARFLKRMRTFSGGNELVNRLLEKYRTIYKRRKSMIEALNGV
jgi:hypothetical protein